MPCKPRLDSSRYQVPLNPPRVLRQYYFSKPQAWSIVGGTKEKVLKLSGV